MPSEIRRSRAAPKKRAEATASRAKDRLVVLAAAAILVLATAAAYHNSLDGPFIFDDEVCIPKNQSIRDLGAIGTVLATPGGGGITVSGRPMLNLSLAIDYALGGTQVRGYHITNLAIHILAGLVLFGIVRRTLLLPSMRGAMLPSSPLRASVGTEACRANIKLPGHASEDGSMAPYLAGAISLLWMVHPLQTESVTYIIQRAESLMGLFYLLTLYCVIRSSSSSAVQWSLAAVVACAMGMATKEVMATAPLIVLLYDRTFLAGSFVSTLRKRWGLYAGLVACWGLLAYLVVSVGGRGGTVGIESTTGDRWSYLQAQFGVILHYLLLTFWPGSLCMDYGTSIARPPAEILSGAVVVGLLVLATVWGFLRGHGKWGFLGAWFLAILAPTSSVIPIVTQVASEHRVYLPLAAVVPAVVLGAFLLWRRVLPKMSNFRGGSTVSQWAGPWLALALVAGALGYRTALRNMDYQSSLAIWQSTIDEYPSNARAHLNLAAALESQKEYDLAAREYRQAIALDPQNAQAYFNLGATLKAQGEYYPAIEQFRQAIRLYPGFAEAHYNLGVVFTAKRRFQEAIEELHIAIRLKPQLLEEYNNLDADLYSQGKVDPAVEKFRQAVCLSPPFADAHNSLGLALESQGKFEEAIEQFRQAVQANPQFLKAYRNLATALGKVGRDQEAREVRRQAAALESAQPLR